MMATVHFLRPAWFLAMLPLIVVVIMFLCTSPRQKDGWSAVCDPHLLPHLLQQKTSVSLRSTPWFLLLAGILMIIALSGPSWTRLPVPTYKKIQPLVILLDMSESMSSKDLKPSRLQRAKFVLHDIFQQARSGQVSLVAYSREPFVVSPLTDDAQTIDALLPALTLDIMPVGGLQLGWALQQARTLIHQAGFQEGKILILTATPPSETALEWVEKLKKQQILTSIIPIRTAEDLSRFKKQFQAVATAGGGEVWPIMVRTADLLKWWYSARVRDHFMQNTEDQMPQWRDEGRWFLWPALLCLLPVFRRGWGD